MTAILYTQELARSPAIYIKDDPCCRDKYRVLPRAIWMVAAHQLTNFRLPHSMWFGALLGISVSSLSVPNQPLWCCYGVCRTNSCSLLAHKGVPHSKTLMRTCIQTVQTAARRQTAWISCYCISRWLHQWDLLAQIKTSKPKPQTRHSPWAQELLSGCATSTHCSEKGTQPPWSGE